MPGEKELNVILMERLNVIRRIKKVLLKKDATLQDVLDVVEEEEGYIREMLYQSPPVTEA